MKKLNIYLTMALALFILQASAQTNMNVQRKGYPADMKNSQKMPSNAKNFGKDQTQSWYFPQDFILEPLEPFVTFLLNDSAKFINTDGTVGYNASEAAAAQIIDPKDDAIVSAGSGDVPQLSRYTNYTVDSMAVQYLYVRKIDTFDFGSGYVPVVDTLFITYYKGTQINTGFSFDNHTKFGYLGWDYAKQFPSNYFKTDTVFLSDTSMATTHGSTGWSQKVLTLQAPANMQVNSNGSKTNNLCAFSLRFKHGLPFDSTYVIEDMRDNPDPNNKYVNYFGYNFKQVTDNGTNPANDDFYNSSLVVFPKFAFASINGWSGWYPNYAVDKYRYPTMGMFLTGLNTGINDIKNEMFASSSVYPNPAKTSEGAVLAFNLKQASTVSINVFTITGQKVKSVAANKSYAAGDARVELSLSDMQPGIYFVNLTANGSTITKKLTIVE